MRYTAATAVMFCLAVGAGLQGQEGPYHAGPVIPIGGEGGWDYLTSTPPAHRLYVSHATHVVVIDTQTNKVVGDIPDTPGRPRRRDCGRPRQGVREQRPREQRRACST